MKLRKILLLSLGMALFAGGGISAALAIAREGHEFSGGDNAFDKAIVLYWGEKQSSVELADLDQMKAGDTAYRYLAVSPEKTVSVAGSVNVNFTLTTGDVEQGKEAVLDGINIEVYLTDSLANDDTVASLINGKTPVKTINKNNTQDTYGITVVGTSASVNPSYFVLKVSMSEVSISSTQKVSGSLTISQSFVAAAAPAQG